MKDNKYFSTGEFAKLANISKQTLIFYDKKRIFSPEYKDENTFRYYSLKQFDTLDILLSLRDIGLSLENIKDYLDNRTPKDAIDMLPGYYNLTLADESSVQSVRTLVNTAIAAGAAEADISNLSKLAECEGIIASLGKATRDAVVNAISALPDAKHIKLSDKADVTSARNLADAALAAGFTTGDITGYQKLLDCEKEIASLEKADELKAAIKSANKAISALPNVVHLKLSDKLAVQEARSLADRALSLGANCNDMPNYNKLVVCEAEIELLESFE